MGCSGGAVITSTVSATRPSFLWVTRLSIRLRYLHRCRGYLGVFGPAIIATRFEGDQQQEAASSDHVSYHPGQPKLAKHPPLWLVYCGGFSGSLQLCTASLTQSIGCDRRAAIAANQTGDVQTNVQFATNADAQQSSSGCTCMECSSYH